MDQPKTIRVRATVRRAVDFEEKYLLLRKKEGRLYSDEELRLLPELSSAHPYKKEWAIRKTSSNKLIHYLGSKKRPLDILEVGCGNGWLCHRLAQIDKTSVTGLDINLLELNQAARVFESSANLSFIYGDMDSLDKFDIIVFAASVQYFASFQETMEAALRHLNYGGEIHILDTRFYEAGEVEEARLRSEEYFSSIGFQEMNDLYFHHAVSAFEAFEYRILYNPCSAINKILRRKNPFYWIAINKTE